MGYRARQKRKKRSYQRRETKHHGGANKQIQQMKAGDQSLGSIFIFKVRRYADGKVQVQEMGNTVGSGDRSH